MSDAHPLDFYPEDETGDEQTDSLVLIDRARGALARAETLADIGDVMEIAERARRYAKAAKLGLDVENHAAALRLEAERKAGEHLADHGRGVGRPEKWSQNGTISSAPLLRDLGLTKRQSSDWQAIAQLPEPVFRQHVAKARTTRRPLTTAGLVQLARRTMQEAQPSETEQRIRPPGIPARIEVADARALPIAASTVHLIVTSPPYSVGIGYAGGGDVRPEDWPSFMGAWLSDALRVTAPGGRLALNLPLDTVSGGYRPTYCQGVMAALSAGWAYRSTIIWADGERGKSIARGSVDSASSPYVYTGAEMVALFSKGAWRREAPCRSDVDHQDWLAWTHGLWRFRGDQTPWEGHPAPFPLELPRRLIQLLSFPGDVVLDPFVGSGTTAVAAVQLGRQAVGFDRSLTYVESAWRRLTLEGDR